MIPYCNDKDIEYQSNILKLIGNLDSAFENMSLIIANKNSKEISSYSKFILNICENIINIKAPTSFKKVQSNISLGCMIYKKVFNELPHKVFDPRWRQNASTRCSTAKKYFENSHKEIHKIANKLNKLRENSTWRYRN